MDGIFNSETPSFVPETDILEIGKIEKENLGSEGAPQEHFLAGTMALGLPEETTPYYIEEGQADLLLNGQNEGTENGHFLLGVSGYLETDSGGDLLTGGGLYLEKMVAEAVLKVRELLEGFAQKPEFEVEMGFAFGNSDAGEKADVLRAGLSGEDLEVLPEIEIVNRDLINGANGAFAGETETIYLAREFVSENLGDVGEIIPVIVEEFGHYLDGEINSIDAPGDEGEIFASFVLDQVLNSQELERLKTENDWATVNIDGRLIGIEQAEVSDSGGFEGSQQIIQLESNGGGTARYSYEFFQIPDQFILRYEGQEILNTGFVSGNQTGQVQIPEGNSNELQVVVATNDEGTNWEYNVSTDTCEDTTPISIQLADGEFDDTDGDGKCEGQGTIFIGRTDGISQMLRVDGSVEFDKDTIAVDGIVSSVIGAGLVTAAPLFQGRFEIDVATGTTRSFQETGSLPNEYQLGGLDVDFSSLTVNQNGLALGASFQLIEELGLPDFFFSGSDALLISQNDVDFGSSVKFSLPTFRDFQLFNFLPVKEFSNFSIEYIAPEDKIKLQGKLEVDPFTKTTKVGSIVADLSGQNFIQIQGGEPDINGSLTINTDIDLPRGWGLNELKLDIDTLKKDVKGSTKLTFPFKAKFPPNNSGQADLGLGFKLPIPPLELNQVSVGVDNLNVQLPIPGFPFIFFQRLAGGVENFASSDADPIEFSGGVGATLGPQVNVPGLGSLALIRADLDGKVNSQQLSATGKTTILNDRIARNEGTATLNWNKKFYETKGNFSFLDGLITTNSGFKIDSKYNINMAGTAAVGIPNFIPLVGGARIGSGNFLVDFSNDGDLSNDFAAGWGTLNIQKLGFEASFVLGVKGYFDGRFERIGAKNIPPTGSFEVPPNTEWIVLSADWENEIAGDVPIEIETPNGTILTEAEFAANNIAIVDELTDSNTKAAIIFNPTPGIWDIQAADETGLGAVQYTAATDSEAPAIQVINPVVDVGGTEVTIDYNAFDADSDAEVKLFYDTDNQGLDGVLIADGLAEADGAGNFVWNTTGVPTGEYYIYAMVVDENNPPAFSYSPGRVLISEETDLSVTQVVNPESIGLGDTITYTTTVTNNGLVSATGVSLTETLPEEVTFVSASIPPAEQSDRNLVFNIGDLPNGASSTVDITVVAPTTPGIISSTAAVASETFDFDATNDVDILDANVEEIASEPVDLSIARTDLPVPVALGQDLTYTLAVANNSLSDATGVVVTQSLPSGVNLIDATSSRGGSFAEVDGVITAELGNLNSGETATVNITLNPFAAGILASSASVAANEEDINNTNNSIIERTTVNPVAPSPADLELTKTVDNPNPNIGDLVNFNLTLTNNGPGIASSIQVADILPAGLSFVSATPEQGTYDSNTGIWDVGNIRDNLSRNLNIATTVNSGGPITNVAQVIAVAEPDPDSTPSNNNPDEDDQASFTINGSGTLPGGIPANTVAIATPAPNNLGTPQNTFSNGFYYLTENDDTAIPAAFAETPVLALAGNDNLAGTEGANYINGDRGSDTLNGLGGNDTLFGGEASDVIDGGTGNDQIWGSTDNDRLNGADGNDTLRGGRENDILTGDSGSDWLWGDSGQDILTGGADNDIFVIATNEVVATPLEQADVITDFQPGTDVIGLANNLLLTQLTFEPVNLQIDGEAPVASTAIKLDSDYLAIVQGAVDANVFATEANFGTV